MRWHVKYLTLQVFVVARHISMKWGWGMERERRKYKECVEINHPKQSRILIRAIVQDAYAASQVHEVYLGTYHSNNDIVRNKFSRIHVLFGELSNFRLIGDGSSQHITSRQMNKAVLVLDDLALRALAAGGSTGDDNLERILDSLADTAAAVGNRSGSSGGRCPSCWSLWPTRTCMWPGCRC